MGDKHTPGPWVWGFNFDGLYGAGPDNEVLHYADYEGMWVANWTGRGVANATLIAASPDLLAELQEAVRLYETYGLLAQTTECGPWINRARAALSKATTPTPSHGLSTGREA